MATQHTAAQSCSLYNITMFIIICKNVYYIQQMTYPPFHYGALVSFLAYFSFLKEKQTYVITILSLCVCVSPFLIFHQLTNFHKTWWPTECHAF
jgi:hypothetical protein